MKSGMELLRVAFLSVALLQSASVFAQEAVETEIIIKTYPDGASPDNANPNNKPVLTVVPAYVTAFDVMTGEILNRTMYDNTLSPQVAQKLADQFNAIVLGKPLDDPNRSANLQEAFDNAQLEDIKIKLNASDDEWAVLLPRIKKLIAAKQNLHSSQDFTDTPLPQTPIRKMVAEFKALVRNPNSSTVEITARLKKYRQASQQAFEECASAQKAVAEVLTLRQEAVLVHMGYMK